MAVALFLWRKRVCAARFAGELTEGSRSILSHPDASLCQGTATPNAAFSCEILVGCSLKSQKFRSTGHVIPTPAHFQVILVESFLVESFSSAEAVVEPWYNRYRG